jgi:MFS family permease
MIRTLSDVDATILADHDDASTVTRSLIHAEPATPSTLADSVTTASSRTGRPFSHGRYNIIILGCAFCILFAAFLTTQSYTTTVNESVGFISLAILYGTMAVAVLFAPTLEHHLGPRLSMVLGSSTYAIYVGCSISAEPSILYPASVLIGVGAALLWTAQGHFLSLNSMPETIGLHSGIFWSCFQVNAIVGNVAAAWLLDSGHSSQFMFTVLCFVACAGVLAFLLLRRVPPDVLSACPKAIDAPPLMDIVSSVFRHLSDRKFLMFAPLFFFLGLSESFMYGSFPTLMPEVWIGWVMSVLGIAECVGSFVYGKLSDFPRIGTITCIMFAAACWTTAFVLTLVNSLQLVGNSQLPLFFASSFLMGLGDAGINTQCFSIVSAVYGTAPAFAGLSFLQSLSLGCGMASGLIFSVEMWVTMELLVLAFALIMLVLSNKARPIGSYRNPSSSLR